ncbi:MAG: GNAT family N-acetyltransferase [Actinobacteria bacterium]|nr:GNAT family N-acetyltransferase [Actinomycetota bacterium]
MKRPQDTPRPSDDPILVRDAEPRDADAVEALVRASNPRRNRLGLPSETVDESLFKVLRVAETSDGLVVGAETYEQLDRDQCWLSGLAVLPGYRKYGIAGLLLQDAVTLARRDRMLTLRYVTETTNDAVHQLSLDHGLRPRGTWLDFRRELDEAACSLGRQKAALDAAAIVRLQPSDRLRVLSLLNASGRTLYVHSGAWRTIDDAVLAKAIEGGAAFFSRSGVGGWGLAIIGARRTDAIEATVYGPDPACAKSLLEHLRGLACESIEGVALTIHAPQDAPIASLLATAVRRREWHAVTEHPLRVWELVLAE